MQDLVDITEIERRIAASENVLVRCTAAWNSRLDNELERWLAEISIDGAPIQTLRLDVDDSRAWEALLSWRVLNIPALVFFRGGNRVETIIGTRPAPELELLFRRWFSGEDAT